MAVSLDFHFSDGFVAYSYKVITRQLLYRLFGIATYLQESCDVALDDIRDLLLEILH